MLPMKAGGSGFFTCGMSMNLWSTYGGKAAPVVLENDIGREELKNQRHQYRRESLGKQGM